jgi:hypothetical protein
MRPWSAGQVVTITAANGMAVALAVAAWWATSGRDTATSQVGWSGVGLLGVVIALAANAWFLARGRQVVRVEQGAVFGRPRFAPFSSDGAAPVADGTSTAVRTRASEDRYLSVRGTVRYHRPACPLVARKDVDEASRSVHEQSGRKACEVCEP